MQVNDNQCIDIEKLLSVALIVRLALVSKREVSRVRGCSHITSSLNSNNSQKYQN